MYKIIKKEKIAESIYSITVDAPKIAAKRMAGQFIVLITDEKGERVPLTIAGSDRDKGTIDIVFQAVGHTTKQLAALEVGDCIRDILGPLGHPTHIENFGTAVCIGGGLGIALAMPITEALHEAGNNVISIISARNESLLLMEDRLHEISNELLIATDDGSKGFHGFPTQILQEMIDNKKKVDIVFAVGPVPLMGAVCKVTKPYKIKTIVSLNPIMVDATGMCGACRVEVGGKTKFACVDGPEFDGHEVDFDTLMKRLKVYNDTDKEESLKDTQAEPCSMEEEKAKTYKIVEEELSSQPVLLEFGKKPKVPRQIMPQQDSETRKKNFKEVPFGYSVEQAQREATRCLQCKKPLCFEGCPVNIDIPAFIKLIGEGDYIGAARKIKETNGLPAVCGRVCPQEDQCEKVCVVGKKGNPVSIGSLERFVADYEREHGDIFIPEIPEKTGHKIAVVGSGPAGLTVAGDLAKKGHDVTIFETLHKAGGVLIYGIPEFRLPKSIVESEIDYLKKLGVKIELNSIIGKTETVDELLNDGFGAVFLGTGAGLPMFMQIPGENLNGVYSANEYLTRVNLMKAYDPEYETPILRRKRVAVLGAGNVAMDSARTALRLGGEHVYVVYRRSRTEMPARIEEVHHGQQEGLEFKYLMNPIRIIGDENGWVKGLECIKMRLGEPDESGRRRPIPIEGTETVLDVECVIVAIGNGPNPLVPTTTPGLKTNRRGNIVADEESGLTSKKGVFAGGDIVTGAATVILAMGAGKKAAVAIDNYVMGRELKSCTV
ncbi:MAG: Dihydroorotate dehydrogenase B (NAD(+)), electron transfer subunit [Candidatus Scalindua arabica]|uniref:Dihydroorotate dehydrogenase B (NAD(+)), electron transfer subunit n=1 Tax=Candidatus Scalindua arabica TaxID=1127984 RepID=A0A941W471_9BACT|nr:Dihydroorotate dehydrogenase B (NAD(+)), electron transfer subunit [Candidatus Scalindua arabica]